MNYKLLFLIIATIFPMILAASPSIPEHFVSCQSPENPCNIYNKYPDCSLEYIKTLEKCEQTGCINWFIDPLAHCMCGNPLQACSTYTQYEDCSPEYVADLKRCIDSKCVNWIQDPLEHCNGSFGTLQ